VSDSVPGVKGGLGILHTTVPHEAVLALAPLGACSAEETKKPNKHGWCNLT
jgi:hypothetical protein